jgi:hopanoid biosynthesis associated protein HpnK
MKRLIVNADDFGLTCNVNRAIVNGHERGIITSTSLMANGRAFDDAVELSRKVPNLGVGIHINLVEGRSLSEKSRLGCLVTTEGEFYGGPESLGRRVLSGRVAPAALEREIRAQIEKVIGAGIDVTHLDSHKHTQAVPAIFKLMTSLAKEYGIGAVRCTVEDSALRRALAGDGMPMRLKKLEQWLMARVMHQISARQRAEAASLGIKCPDSFFGVTETGFLDERALDRILAALPDGTSELMCHPGYADNELEELPTRLVEQRETELRTLTQPDLKEHLTTGGICLISFREIMA